MYVDMTLSDLGTTGLSHTISNSLGSCINRDISWDRPTVLVLARVVCTVVATVVSCV